MTDILRLLQVNKTQMFKQAQEEFLGATALMEGLVRHGSLPMRKAKMVMERAVKYSEKAGKGKVSYQSLKKALTEMKVDISMTEKDVERMQNPEKILAQAQSVGAPSAKRMKENVASLRKRVEADKNWLLRKRKGIEKARALIFKMEKELFY
jgi:argininosuccinate lyase